MDPVGGRLYVEMPLDRMRRLRYTINAMRELEGIFGTGITGVFSPDRVGYNQITYLIWIGLKHGGDRKLAVEDVGDLLQEHWLDKGREMKEALDYALDGLRLAGLLPRDKDRDQQDSGGGQSDPSKAEDAR